MDVQAKLEEGREHHRAGRFGEAARCYKAVLEADCDNVDGLNLMSVLAQMAGDNRAAAALAMQAISLQPDWHAPYVALGNALQAEGEFGRAVDAFQKAVTLCPEAPEPYLNLANALNETGRHAEAAKAAVDAIVIDGSLPEAHNAFGNALAGMDSPEEAVEAYQKAVYLRPDWDVPWFNIGVALAAQGKHGEALASYRHAIGLVDGAAKRYNLGNSLAALGRLDEAVGEYRAALALDPGYVDAHNNLGATLKDLERLDEAESCLRRAVESAPQSPDLHWNLALTQLMRGDWENGWREYEWRWRMPTFAPFVRDFACLPWQGEDLAGKTILVSAEQGFGDAIEFCRLAPLLARRGARVVLECRQGLKRLFSTLAGIDRVVTPGDDYGHFDFAVPLMSLPLRLGLTPETLPPPPYLAVPDAAAGFAGPDGVAGFAGPDGVVGFADVAALDGLKVGLVWAGGASRRDNAQRSCTAADLRPLLGIAGCRFFSLQVGPESGQVADLPGVVDLSPRLGDFADTAAALAALDLLVSVDTGVAHLAGALGRPVRLLLSRPSNGFLWMTKRPDSPWYPGDFRLLRQSQGGDWSGPVEQVAAELRRRTTA